MRGHAVASVFGGALLLTGCAFGRHHAYHLADPLVNQGGRTSIALAVQDQRDSVLMGGRPDFVGLSRGGFGNAFDVTTASGQPLAADFTASIRRGLERAGYRVSSVAVMDRSPTESVARKLAKAGADRSMLVQIDTWKSDTYSGTQLFYGVTIQVFDASGQVLGRAATSGRDIVGRDFVDPGGLAEEALPKIYALKLELLLNDRAIARSLVVSRPPPAAAGEPGGGKPPAPPEPDP